MSFLKEGNSSTYRRDPTLEEKNLGVRPLRRI